MAEVLYEDSSPQLLELIRRNWSVVLNHNKGAIAPDDVCEKINLWSKLLPFTPYFEKLVKKTERLSLAQRCCVEIGSGGGNAGNERLSTAPKREDEYKRLFCFFNRFQLFQGLNPGRLMGENSFLEFIILDGAAQTSRTNREKGTVPLSVHEEELETIFCSMKMSNAVVASADSTINSNDQIEEDDDNEDDDEQLEDEDVPSINPVETEEEWIAALKKLSQVKKYFLNLLALKDLNVIGREMLGQDMKETRSKQRDDQKKMFSQINKAVAHFQNGAIKHRQGLEGRTANDRNNEATSSNCHWEVEYANMLPKN
jgi:hypothetical protein